MFSDEMKISVCADEPIASCLSDPTAPNLAENVSATNEYGKTEFEFDSTHSSK